MTGLAKQPAGRCGAAQVSALDHQPGPDRRHRLLVDRGGGCRQHQHVGVDVQPRPPGPVDRDPGGQPAPVDRAVAAGERGEFGDGQSAVVLDGAPDVGHRHHPVAVGGQVTGHRAPDGAEALDRDALRGPRTGRP